FAGPLPDRQGRGIGSTLIKTVLARCDDEHIPAYLEATADRNRRLYERLGVETRARIDLPGGPPMGGVGGEPRHYPRSQLRPPPLALNGVLFLDEPTEFRRDTVEAV